MPQHSIYLSEEDENKFRDLERIYNKEGSELIQFAIEVLYSSYWDNKIEFKIEESSKLVGIEVKTPKTKKG